MAATQQHFINSHTVKINNVHIMNLDAPVKNMIRRKYLMSRAPNASVIQRISSSSSGSSSSLNDFFSEHCVTDASQHLRGAEANGEKCARD
jgi:hypothetical protein